MLIDFFLSCFHNSSLTLVLPIAFDDSVFNQSIVMALYLLSVWYKESNRKHLVLMDFFAFTVQVLSNAFDNSVFNQSTPCQTENTQYLGIFFLFAFTVQVLPTIFDSSVFNQSTPYIIKFISIVQF